MIGKVLIALGFIFVVSQTPLTAQGSTISIPGDHPTITAALESAQPGDRIELSPGVYSEFNLILPEDIVLIGMGDTPSEVIIDGGGRGRLILAESLTIDSTIENLTLTGGLAAGPSSYDQSGGALLASNSTLKIANCVFTGNEAEGHGGAIRCTSSDVVVYDTVFIGNHAPEGGGGAVDCSYGSNPQFRNCDFKENSASWGGALSCRADSSPIVSDSRFRNNIAQGLGFGGAVFSDYEATPLFSYSTFHGNSALYGGALASFQNAETNLENCTITGNTAQYSGAGLFCNDSSPRVTGSIIAFQEGTGIAAQGAAVPIISCTDLYGNSQGDWVGNISGQADALNNLSADPIFCSENPGLDGEYGLQDNSPCGEDLNDCGTLGAWPIGCESVAAQLTTFGADWNGSVAKMTWKAISNGETLLFRLTGALESSPDEEWEISYVDEGGGLFVGEDDKARSDSGRKYVYRLYLIDDRGQPSLLAETKLVSVPDYPGIRDLKASPNPFNPLTTISFRLGKSQQARVSIFTVDGRKVTTLSSGSFEAGIQEVAWNGTDDNGRRMGTGAYIALVEGEHQMQTVKITMVK